MLAVVDAYLLAVVDAEVRRVHRRGRHEAGGATWRQAVHLERVDADRLEVRRVQTERGGRVRREDGGQHRRRRHLLAVRRRHLLAADGDHHLLRVDEQVRRGRDDDAAAAAAAGDDLDVDRRRLATDGVPE